MTTAGKERRLLCIDGGGVRGVLALAMLERLWEQPGFSSGVTTIAGTSTGGIIALGLARGLTPSQLLEQYLKGAPEVFKDSTADNLKDFGTLLGAQYGATPLWNLCTRILGHKNLSECHHEVVIPVTRFDYNRYRLKVYHNFKGPDRDSYSSAAAVAVATSSAPTYFPAFRNAASLSASIDGGLVANNPTMVGVTQCLDVRNDEPSSLSSVRVLSLSCGHYAQPYGDIPGDWGLLKWAPRIIPAIMEAQLDMVSAMASALPLGSYQRLEPPVLRKWALDDWKQMDQGLADIQTFLSLIDWPHVASTFLGVEA